MSRASSIKGFTGSGSVTTTKKKAAINIFSVASGHLYERFLSIMILSVIKNTDSRVKFWFIENFLSPSFKVSFITLFSAGEYGIFNKQKTLVARCSSNTLFLV